MGEGKIFVIGFHKTGTSSIDKALRILGFRVCGTICTHDLNIEQNVYQTAFNLVNRYDAFQDNPWPILYKQLDQKYPGSKFVLTLRPTNQWIKSMVNSFYTESSPMRQWIYGVGYPKGNEDIYINRYEQHNEEVLNYFKNRPGDLLVLRITEGEGWEKLCPFIGREIPTCEFPLTNKGLGVFHPLGVIKRLAKRYLPQAVLFRWRRWQNSKIKR